jgi:molecular chaperone GrpE
MNDGEMKVNIKEDGSETETAIEDEGAQVADDHTAKEKPIQNMSKSELIERVAQLQEEAKKNYDLFLRSEAESENLKKRNKKEKEDWIKYANETLVKEILPVLDNLEKAISHSQEENSLQALREGVELTLKGLKDSLAKSGLEEVRALGEPFDPSFHHAVSEQEDEKLENGAIIHELQKGYTFNQRLIRPAMVVVNKAKPGDTATNNERPS